MRIRVHGHFYIFMPQAFYHLPFICARGGGFEMKG